MNPEQEPAPQPQPNPVDSEQLVLDFGDQHTDAQPTVYDWAQEGKADNTANETLTDHDVDPDGVAVTGIKRAIQEHRANRQVKKAQRAADLQVAMADIEPSTGMPSSYGKTVEKQPKATADSKTAKHRITGRLDGRKAKKQAKAADARIAQLDDELSGASSIIATMKGGVYTRSLEKNTYQETDQPLAKKRRAEHIGDNDSPKTFVDTRNKLKEMSNVDKLDYEQKVEELNTLRGFDPNADAATKAEPAKVDMSDDELTTYIESLTDDQNNAILKLMDKDAELADKLMAMSNQDYKDFIDAYIRGELGTDAEAKKGDWRELAGESDLPKHEVKRFFEAVPAAELKMLEAYSPEDRDIYIDMWLNDNPRDKAAHYMNQDVFNEFVDSLNDEEYDTFVSIPESEQNKWALDWYKDTKGPKVVVHPAGTMRAAATKSFPTKEPHFKYPKQPRVVSQKQGLVKRISKATSRGASKTLDFMAMHAGQYSIPKDKR